MTPILHTNFRTRPWVAKSPFRAEPVPGGFDSASITVLVDGDATAVASRVGALFGTRRWLFDCEVTLPAGREREFGEAGVITYPTFATQTGARARIVGRSFDTGAMTMTLTVLI